MGEYSTVYYNPVVHEPYFISLDSLNCQSDLSLTLPLMQMIKSRLKKS